MLKMTITYTYNSVVGYVLNFFIYDFVEHILTFWAFSTLIVVIFFNLLSTFFGETVELRSCLEKATLFSFFHTILFFIFHWIDSGFFPLTNLTESLAFLSCISSVIFLISKTRNTNKRDNIYNVTTRDQVAQYSATFNVILSLVFFGWNLFFSPETEKSQNLVVAGLQSQWLVMHVSIILFGYLFLFSGSLLAISFILFLELRNSIIRNCIISIIMLSPKSLSKKYFELKRFMENITFFLDIPFLESLDFWSYRMISFGFVFLTLGILAGAVWANEAWGEMWSWDPKETWALITWITFAICLHIRKTQRWKGQNFAFIAFIGFLLIWICYFGINLLGIGLHSYGSFNSK